MHSAYSQIFQPFPEVWVSGVLGHSPTAAHVPDLPQLCSRAFQLAQMFLVGRPGLCASSSWKNLTIVYNQLCFEKRTN